MRIRNCDKCKGEIMKGDEYYKVHFTKKGVLVKHKADLCINCFERFIQNK